MAETSYLPSRLRRLFLPFILTIAAVLLFAGYLCMSGLAEALSLSSAPNASLQSVQLFYGALPRVIVALAAGGLLGLATTLMQQGLGNPLAEPGTIGLLSTSRLTVAVALIWLPAFAGGFVLPVLAGSLFGLVILLGLSWRRKLSPLFLILNGLVLGLVCDAVTSMLILTHYEDIADLLLWQSGSLVQDNWQVARLLSVCLAAVSIITILLRKPLSLLDLDDTAARSLGLSPMMARLAAIGLATVAAAAVTAHVGLLAFVGLAGAALARICGARGFADRAMFSALLSAALLLLTDQTMQIAEMVMAIPAGTVTALFAAPLLLYLLHSGRIQQQTERAFDLHVPHRIVPTRSILLGLTAVFVFAILLALMVGRAPQGFTWATANEFSQLLPWRWPRVTAALAAGGMVALAGCLMQRMTGNHLASPELIGVSSGATLVMLPVIFFLPPLSRSQTMLVAAIGALLFLLIALRLARRSQYAPEKLLLTGLAITALSGSLLSSAIYFGDIRLTRLIGWLSGSTYAVTAADAMIALGLLAAAVAVLPLIQRWLGLMPLGEPVAAALGVEIRLARLCIIILVALLTGVSTVMIGPVTFVGLVIPHLVRLMGLRKPLAQTTGCVLAGATLMIVSDWIGRTIAFPWDIPAGLVASVVGAMVYGITTSRSSR
ncbi:Fe(3+)-hydroxamate ABC transporter permease FhuB [Rhizobiales bacterium RZME27]|uniref:Fe(3+)-hydroxamate ABC transporter permease FhuB n=1 Tax=Endobacterium cereale TaxID=2663029 RepID=A0A6A8AK50_9HYPH|nr:Fe(3+)-hydroxamate ABC transporter permease FhuB [Endobacterium cereale]MQY49546.1 Fe(3+)-hydroxamate ABC transporter permease FhuB [Endobacterium cereale]